MALLAIGLLCLWLLGWRSIWLLCAAGTLLFAQYILYGFVGLAFWLTGAKKLALSNFFLALTFSPTLLPFRKAFYFWTKSMNLLCKNPKAIQKAEFEKAFALAKKINIDKLGTDNNRAMVLSFLAPMYYDTGDKEKAYDCIRQAQALPNKKAKVEEGINRLIGLLASDLKSDEIFLKLNKIAEADPEKGWSPYYDFTICLADGTEAGHCNFRLGYNEKLYYGGHIGYTVFEPYQGNHYAAKACLLLFGLARMHGMEYLYITCTPENAASRKTCERVGGVLEAIVDLPPDNDMYLAGERQKCVYRVNLPLST